MTKQFALAGTGNVSAACEDNPPLAPSARRFFLSPARIIAERAMLDADRRIEALIARFDDPDARTTALMRRIDENAKAVDAWLASIPK